MTTLKIAPPSWDDDKPIETWKLEIELWKVATDIHPTKQGPTIALALSGRKREAVLEIPTEELARENGLELLVTKLEGRFGREKIDQIYEVYEKFENVRRGDMDMAEYISQFESFNNAMVKMGMKLPDAVLGCKLLYCAGLDFRERQLILAATKGAEYENMKAALRRIYIGAKSHTSQMKEEPAFVSSDNHSFESAFASKTGSKQFRGRETGFPRVLHRVLRVLCSREPTRRTNSDE